MRPVEKVHVSEEEARKLAEASRQKEWEHPSFLRELFLGRFRLELLDPFPIRTSDRPEFQAFRKAFLQLLRDRVDPVEIDRTGDYPQELIEELRKLGAFGMKIPAEYGGLGFTSAEYAEIMELIGSWDGNVSALLSAHQSIGVPQPIKLFGTEEQKKRFLPRCAQGAISAFALTEPDVGSDPARMRTTYERTPDGRHFRLDGIKLWCTNGTIADLLVVMAAEKTTKKISAFVVEGKSAGITVTNRCHFMGLRALANAEIRFDGVLVPVENLIGAEGRGLKIALTTLNAGRLSIPACSVGTAKACLEISRRWAAERVQWGRPVGRHEAIAHKLSSMAATTFAMEAVSEIASAMADRGSIDIRLEAAAAKLWNTERTWQIVDDTMQIRGGRGYETSASLGARGEPAIPVEQIFRDYRINRIFEGSSEIMHLFMAREAVDRHLEIAGDLIDPKKSLGEKLRALLRATGFYLWWYPSRFLGWSWFPRFRKFGNLAKHLRFVDRSARRLARAVFHGMVVHQGRLQHKQGFLFRLVDIANGLFAMAAAVAKAASLQRAGDPRAAEAVQLADLFGWQARLEIADSFRSLWRNVDALAFRAGCGVVEGKYQWLEEGIVGVDAGLRPGQGPAERRAAATESAVAVH